MKAFVNELMRDASDATRRQKVIGITRSDSILFQFSFSFRERFWTLWERVEKAEEWEHHHSPFYHRRQNEGDDKEDDEEEVDVQRRVPWVRRKKGGIVVFPWRFFAEKLSYMKYHKEEAKISSLERTERDQKHEKERERAFFFF